MAYPKVLVDGREYIPRLAPAINESETLAQYLTFLRRENGLGIGDVEALTGIRTYRIELWEENAAGLPFNEAVLLCRAYGISVDLLALRVLAEADPDAPADRPLATHFDHQGKARVARIRDPLRQELPQSQIKIDPPLTVVEPEPMPEPTPEPEPVVLEVDEVEDDTVEITEADFIHFTVDLDTDDTDDYIEEDEGVEAGTVSEAVEPEAVEAPAEPVDQRERLQDALDALL